MRRHLRKQMNDAIGGTDGLMGSCALGTEKGFIGRDCAKLIELAAASEEGMKYIFEYTPVTGSTKRICTYCR